jgi:hypothetical protein
LALVSIARSRTEPTLKYDRAAFEDPRSRYSDHLTGQEMPVKTVNLAGAKAHLGEKVERAATGEAVA